MRYRRRLHHIGVGRDHTGTRVILLAQDLYVRVVDASTGELLRDLILNPNRGYQGTGKPPGPPKGRPKKKAEPIMVQPVSYLLRDDNGRGGQI